MPSSLFFFAPVMDRIFLLGNFHKYRVGELKTNGLIISFFLSCEKSPREVLQKKRDTRAIIKGSFIVFAGRTGTKYH